MKKVTKRIFKILLWIIGVFIALDLLLVTLIITPPVQQFILVKVSKILTNITGGEITVEKIYLTPTLNLKAKNFAIKDHHYENMIFAETLKAKINLKKSKNGQICLSFAQLDVGEVVFRKYAGEDGVNIAIWAKGFKKENKKENKLKLLFENIKLNDVRFVIILDDKLQHKEDNTIDYAFFELQHIVFDAENFFVKGDDISCKIKTLTLCQHTGFEITSFTSDFRIWSEGLTLDNLHFTTPKSTFEGDFAFKYNHWSEYSDFVNLIHFDTKINKTILSMQDVVYFAPALEGMDNQLILKGYVGGAVNHLQTKDLYVKYGVQTHIAGDFDIINILDAKNGFKNSSFNMFFKDVYINYSELTQFHLPGNKKISFPNELEKIGWTRIGGDFRGSLTKFNTDLVVQTGMGTVETDITTSTIDEQIFYSGNITCHDINIGKFLNLPQYLNKVDVKSSINGYANPHQLDSSISIGLEGKITHIDVCGYPLRNVDFNGNYSQKNVNLALQSYDSLASFNVRGKVDFAKELPIIDASLSHVKLKLSEFFSYYSIDSYTTKGGFDKFVSLIHQNPNLVFSMDSISMAMNGNKLENMNGFIGIDYARLTNGEKTSRIDWARLIAINNPTISHQLQFHSNAINASLKSSYNVSDCITVLLDAANYYIPDMFGYQLEPKNNLISDVANPFIDFELQFYYTQNLFNLILPKLNIMPNAFASFHLGENRNEDTFSVVFPRVSFADLGIVHYLTLDGKMNKDEMFGIQLLCDSISIFQKKGPPLTFRDINADTRNSQKEILFDLSWRNPKVVSVDNINHFKGNIWENEDQNISLKINESELFLRESLWQFTGNKNIISYNYNNGELFIDQCVLNSDIGRLTANGEISNNSGKELNIRLDNFDISLLNKITAKKGITFDGNMELMAVVSKNLDQYLIEGKTFVNNFVFNDETMGDMFLDATIYADGTPYFTGGILSGKDNFKMNLSKFNYLDYLKLPNRIINLNGRYSTKEKDLRVHAEMDTLKIGFLSPFLESFSNVVSGYASGELDFIMTADSLYFDGKVKVKNAKMGITPLNTVYNIVDQEILFNKEGIQFNQVKLTDKFNNKAILNGYVNHNKFKDFLIDLNISTDRLLALNTPKKMDISFFGDGIIAGDLSIKGDTKQLNFTSRNLTTLSGSNITFPLTSTSSVSSSQGIYFIQNDATKNDDQTEKKSSTIMNFDIQFDVTRDADVRLELDPIDGLLQCKTSGKLHLLYNTESDEMMLDGSLSIMSGKFHISLKNFFPKDFFIVEGGTITFEGDLYSALINVKALYQKTASLKSLGIDIGRTEVSAYLGLTGNLFNPTPTFSFAFPRLTDQEQLQVYAALDTVNQQEGLRQFFSFVFLNSFISSGGNIDEQQALTTGIDMLSGMLNSMFSGQQNNVNFGFNYFNNKDETSLYTEYSVNTSVKLNNDRLLLKANLGVGQENIDGENSNSFVGDAGLDWEINDNWKMSFFYFNDGANVNKKIPIPEQGGGISLNYKKDFNNRKDFVNKKNRKKL